MAKKKKKTTWFNFGGGKAKKKKTKNQIAESKDALRKTLLTLLVIAIVGLAAVGFVWLDSYVKTAAVAGERYGPIELIDPPEWISDELTEEIKAKAGGDSFAIDKDTAEGVAKNLWQLPWLYDVRVQTTSKTIAVAAKYRKPVATVKQKSKVYYVSVTDDYPADETLVLLEYLKVDKLPVVEIKSFSRKTAFAVGQIFQDADVIAAVRLLHMLAKMDELTSKDQPLLGEIASIDVSNAGGRRSSRNAHILMFAKDGTEIRWGAAPGEATRYVEAPEKEKIANLYEFYKQNGTLQGVVKYIELRHPQ